MAQRFAEMYVDGSDDPWVQLANTADELATLQGHWRGIGRRWI